jgi:glycosyltransferase involved in cell wall biosynthesis
MKASIYGCLAAKLAGIGRRYSEISGLGYLFSSAAGLHRAVQSVGRLLLRTALAGNSMVFFLNPDDRDDFIARRILRPSSPTMVSNGDGVDLNRFAPAPIPELPLAFLLIARVQYDKGIAEYAEASRILRARHPNVHFRLLGPFDDHPSAIERDVFQQWVKEGVIEYMGGTPDVRPFIAASHVYVLPSYREGGPISALEAMAMGRPVVMTDVPGCRYRVRDGDNGFLVPVRDPAALAAAMQRFIDDPALVARMGQRSRLLSEEIYDVREIDRSKLEAMGLAGQSSQTDPGRLGQGNVPVTEPVDQGN